MTRINLLTRTYCHIYFRHKNIGIGSHFGGTDGENGDFFVYKCPKRARNELEMGHLS